MLCFSIDFTKEEAHAKKTLPPRRHYRHDLLEILENRNGLKSILVTYQLPVKHWHEQIGDPTMADAILDRLVHNSHKIKLDGESMRKKKAILT